MERQPNIARCCANDPLDVRVDSIGLQLYGRGQLRQQRQDVKARLCCRMPHLIVDTSMGLTGFMVDTINVSMPVLQSS